MRGLCSKQLRKENFVIDPFPKKMIFIWCDYKCSSLHPSPPPSLLVKRRCGSFDFSPEPAERQFDSLLFCPFFGGGVFELWYLRMGLYKNEAYHIDKESFALIPSHNPWFLDSSVGALIVSVHCPEEGFIGFSSPMIQGISKAEIQPLSHHWQDYVDLCGDSYLIFSKKMHNRNLRSKNVNT